MTGYEKYQLQWMIDHGYSIRDLIHELSKYQQWIDCGESQPLDEIFDEWEYNAGFGSEIWACENEWLDCEAEYEED